MCIFVAFFYFIKKALIFGATNNIDSATIAAAIAQERIQTNKKRSVKPRLTATSTKVTKKVVSELIKSANCTSSLVIFIKIFFCKGKNDF
jgi:hypothetical protein